MAQPVTELAYITLAEGRDIQDTEVSQIWADTLKTLGEQKGVQRYRWGTQVERKEVIVLTVDWDEQASHDKFIASSIYKPFVDHLGQVTTKIHLHHNITSPSPPATVLSAAPVIEVASFFSTEVGFLENAKKFVEALDNGTEDGKVVGYHGTVVTEVVEEIAKGGAEEGKGKAVGLWIGWDSVEAHMNFRETALFKEKVGLLREKRGPVDMFHVTFKTTEIAN